MSTLITTAEATKIAKEHGYKIGKQAIERNIRGQFGHLGTTIQAPGSLIVRIEGVKKQFWVNYLKNCAHSGRKLFSLGEI